MDKKTVWQLRLLDKLYFINHHDKSIDDTPIMSMSIDSRDIIINGITLDDNNALFIIDRFNHKLFFNKSDAEVELQTWKFTLKIPIQ